MKPITLAIRKLLDQKGDELTHSDAAPLLAEIGKKEGFEVAENPGGKSEDYAKMEQYELNWEDDANVQAVAEACGLSGAALQRCRKEAVTHRTWKLQENQFNVTKNTWKKEKASGVSKRPQATKNVRAKAAKTEQKKRGRPPKVVDTGTVKRRGRPAKIVMPSMDDLDEIAALKYVESHGGLPAVNELLAKAQAEAAYLSRVLELHANLRSRVDASGKAKVAKTSAA
jgi:hypothetical protein